MEKRLFLPKRESVIAWQYSGELDDAWAIAKKVNNAPGNRSFEQRVVVHTDLDNAHELTLETKQDTYVINYGDWVVVAYDRIFKLTHEELDRNYLFFKTVDE